LRLAGALSGRPRSSVKPSEEQVRRREEHDRKSLMIALEVYKGKNMEVNN
jgi:hypothetical protein